MKKYRILIFALLIPAILGILIFRSFRYDWNPHYLKNKDVTIKKKTYSPDSSVAVVYYALDVGARGIRAYKSLLKEKDYDDDLILYNLPPQLIADKWENNKTLFVTYDPNQAFIQGGGLTDLDLKKDTLIRNGISVIIKQRIKENRDSVFNHNIKRYWKK